MALTREDLENDLLRRQYEGMGDAVPLLSGPAFDASLEAILAERNPRRDLWVFAYGSLIWNPLIRFSEQRRARLHGFHRRFCLRSRGARGTAEHPGLVLGLDFGGSCNGIVYRIDAAIAHHELKLIWRREMVLGSYAPRWVSVAGGERRRQALAFVVNHAHPHYAGRLPDAELTRILATAHGRLGSCADYLMQTVASLEGHGVYDAHLARLQRQVLAARKA